MAARPPLWVWVAALVMSAALWVVGLQWAYREFNRRNFEPVTLPSGVLCEMCVMEMKPAQDCALVRQSESGRERSGGGEELESNLLSQDFALLRCHLALDSCTAT